jgi:short-subunit dehydrogenase
MSQTALVTGASSGIGREFADILASRGHNLVLAARREEELNKLKGKLESQYRVNVVVFARDLSDLSACDDLCAELKRQGIAVDILINNAGFGDFVPFAEADWQKLDTMMHLNMLSLTRLTKLLLPAMLERRHGRILNMASTAAFQPGPLMAVYFATKAYVLSFSQALANEVAGSGVTVTVLCPGPTESGFRDAAGAERSKLFAGKIPSSRVVAEYGYPSMMKGKLVAIHGAGNWLLANSTRFTPRRTLLKIVRWLVEQK